MQTGNMQNLLVCKQICEKNWFNVNFIQLCQPLMSFIFCYPITHPPVKIMWWMCHVPNVMGKRSPHAFVLIQSLDSVSCVFMLLAASPLGLSKLWGGDVVTSYIDYSGPRIRCLLLHSLLIEPTPSSLPATWCPYGGGISLLSRILIHWRPSCCCTISSANLGVTRLHPNTHPSLP